MLNNLLAISSARSSLFGARVYRVFCSNVIVYVNRLLTLINVRYIVLPLFNCLSSKICPLSFVWISSLNCVLNWICLNIYLYTIVFALCFSFFHFCSILKENSSSFVFHSLLFNDNLFSFFGRSPWERGLPDVEHVWIKVWIFCHNNISPPHCRKMCCAIVPAVCMCETVSIFIPAFVAKSIDYGHIIQTLDIST